MSACAGRFAGMSQACSPGRRAGRSGGLGGLLMLGSEAARGQGGARGLRWAIGGLDQLSKRMRALATEHSTQRLDAAARRAGERHRPAPAALFEFRLRDARWPAWVVCDEHGAPMFERGLLRVDVDHPSCPEEGSSSWRMTVRDAYLVAGRQAPVAVDGRAQMAARYRGDSPAAKRRARRTSAEWELAELARLSGMPARTLAQFGERWRADERARLRRAQADRARAELDALHDQLASRPQKRDSDG